MSCRCLWVFFLLLCALTLPAPRVLAWDDIPRAVIESGKQATAFVETKEGSGSAFCIDAEGEFVTNQHVVGTNTRVKLVLNSGETNQKVVFATVIEQDAELDLALLKADGPGPWKSIPLAPNNADLIETTLLVAFGFPYGKALSVDEEHFPSITISTGRVTALRKSKGVLAGIQLDASVNPGSSGGPVVDQQGRVIGIVVLGLGGAGLNFAIPIDDLQTLLHRPHIIVTSSPIPRTKLNRPNPINFQVTPQNGRHGDYQITFTLDPQTDHPHSLPVHPTTENNYTVTLDPFPNHVSSRHYELVAKFEGKVVAQHTGIIEAEKDPNLPTGEAPQTDVPPAQAEGQSNGSISFQAPIVLTIPGMKLYNGLRLADLDGDGHLDILVTSGTDLVVLYGHGDGTTFDMIRYPMGEDGSQIRVADLNHDGRPDVVIVGGRTVHVLLCTGPRKFAAPRRYPTGDGASCVAVGDFNGDGHPDLAVTNMNSNDFAVLLNRGDGTFDPATNYPLPQYAISIVAADFNGDGKLDLAANCFYASSTQIFLGDGNGGFHPSTIHPETGGGQLVVGDFKGDGHMSIGGLNYWSSGLGIALGDGKGNFDVSRVGTNQYPSQICLGDFDGDGRPDILFGNQGTNTFTLCLNAGDGHMKDGLPFTVPEGDVHAAVMGDLNEDGRMDIVADGGQDHLFIFLNNSALPSNRKKSPAPHR